MKPSFRGPVPHSGVATLPRVLLAKRSHSQLGELESTVAQVPEKVTFDSLFS